jgi:predicted Zn-dependent protease
MKEKILQTLQDLREYAISKNYEVTLSYHEEDSYLMRFANSAISLNTNEHLIRLEITAYQDKKRASYELITDLNKPEEMKAGIDTAADMVQYAQPLNYQPTIPVYETSFEDVSAFDINLARMSSEEKLEFINQAVDGLETDKLKLSGIFSSGANTFALINTRSPHSLYFKSSDAQITLVLAHETLKWEVTAEQSAWNKSNLNAESLHSELAFLINRYENDQPQQIPLGNYDVVFGAAAIAEMISFMNWIAFDGGLMKRGFSFMKEEQIGEKILSDQFTLVDDASNLETFPFKRDLMGLKRKKTQLVEKGVFKGFVWSQDEADEFDQTATGHTVPHKSLVVEAGNMELKTIQELAAKPRDKDILYIPFLHYMNIVNPSKGIVTGSSRFGALLLKKDGTIIVPYNVRLTHSLLDIFGDKIAWLSNECVAYNVSNSYGARNPTAIIVPKFMKVNDLKISHSNDSY